MEAHKGLIRYPPLEVQEQAKLMDGDRIVVTRGVGTDREGHEGSFWGGDILDLDLHLGWLYTSG